MGVILQSAIKAFLKTPRDDHRWLKQLTRAELLVEINKLKPQPWIPKEAKKHQLVSFLLGVAYPGFAYWLDMGTGKTLLSLMLLRYWWDTGDVNRAIIVVKSEKAFRTWVTQINRWKVGIPYTLLGNSTSEEKWEKANGLAEGLIIVTYPGLSRMVTKPGKKKKGKRPLKILPSRIDKVTRGVNALVLDECFPVGTLVATPVGDVAIEKLRVGDLVTSSKGVRRVSQLCKKLSSQFVLLRLSDGSYIRCTPNHPFFTDQGWICAGNLEGRYLYDQIAMSNLWKANSSSQILQQILLREMVEYSYSIGGMEPQEWKLEQGTTLARGVQTTTPGNRFEPGAGLWQEPWGEWQVPSRGSTPSTFSIRPAVDTGASHFIRPQAAWLSNLLQGRLSPAQEKVGYRSGWCQPSWKKTIGPEEGCSSGRVRVESVESEQLLGPENVFTLEVEGCPHFYAGGYLVHNSTNVGHHDSLITRTCGRIRRRVKFCYALAGRPFGRDPTLLWSQYMIIDGGETFGETLGLFKEAFYTKEESEFSAWPKFVFDKDKMKPLMKMAQHRSISYGEHECIDVPKFTSIVEEVDLPQEAEAYYKRVVQQIIAAKGNLQAMENAFIRMRQLSSGFLGFRNEDDGKRVEVAFQENPKLERLLELLDGLPADRKAVVFYSFTWSGRKIVESLKGIDLKGIWLWGGSKNSDELQRQFFEDPTKRIAVINDKTGAYSLDGLQDVANYTMFYESPVPVIDREQAERRVRRQGQKRRVFQYDLVVNGTMDRRILQFHKEGDSLLEALRANPAQLIRDLK